jgi:hypothetical protein
LDVRAWVERCPLVAILRGIQPAEAESVCYALERAGVCIVLMVAEDSSLTCGGLLVFFQHSANNCSPANLALDQLTALPKAPAQCLSVLRFT